jgi:hypothetical protein
MDMSKLKGYLTGHKKMSEKDADDHLARLAKPEHAEEMKQLSMDFDAWAKEEEKEHAAKLTAAREGITKLRASFKTSIDSARLQASQGRIVTRLSKLRADGKVTPAEIKKMDLVSLASKPQNEIDLVLKTYDDREPVIMVGQRGTTKASDLSKLSSKEKEMQKLEADSRKNMSLLRGVDAGKTKLSSEHVDGRTEGTAPPPVTTEEDRGEDHMAYFEKEYDEISKMMAGGQHGEAKARLEAFMTKHFASSGGGGEYTAANAEEAERHLAALAENMTKMQSQFDEAIKLAADLAG